MAPRIDDEVRVNDQCNARRPLLPRALCVLACLLCGSAGADETLYYFIDEAGTPHFSNVPADPRYKPYHADDGGGVLPGSHRSTVPGAGVAPDQARPARDDEPLQVESEPPPFVDEQRDEREPAEPPPADSDR